MVTAGLESTLEVRERLALLELLDLIRIGNEKDASIAELRKELDGLRTMAASRGRSDLEPAGSARDENQAESSNNQENQNAGSANVKSNARLLLVRARLLLEWGASTCGWGASTF